MDRRLIGAHVAAALVLIATAAQAQDISAGRQIAQTWCSGCHNIDSQEQKTGSDAVPSFPAIAQINSTTTMSIAAFLSSPHAGMPNYVLSRTEILNLSVYILSLRKTR